MSIECPIPDIKVLHSFFTNMNKLCSESGETVEPLTNVDYYEEQIHNIFGGSYSRCTEAAKELKAFEESIR